MTLPSVLPGTQLAYQGRIVVPAAEGDHVDDGDTQVILESMKMEIPVLAESPGVVATMHVAEGDVVQEGDLIAVIS